MTVGFRTSRDAAESVLPNGFTPNGDHPLVTVRLRMIDGLAWLAGRGYNYVEVLLDSAFNGKDDREDGDFVAVMWENAADPIIVGRDEAGHPKLFADIPTPAVDHRGTRAEASWDGHVFFRMTLDGYEFDEISPDVVAHGDVIERQQRGRFNLRYFPRADRLDEAAVSEVVFTPPTVARSYVLDKWSGRGETAFLPATWQQIPTFSHITNALAQFPVVAWEEASVVQSLNFFDDLRDSLRILT